MNFYDNLKTACNNKGLKVTPFIEMFGLNSANTGAWKKGGYPRVEVLIKMASALDVTTDYLLGREKNEKDSHVVNYGESPTKYEIKELIDTVLEKTNDEEELNALKILLEKFVK